MLPFFDLFLCQLEMFCYCFIYFLNLDYNNLSSSSIKSYRRRNQNVIKEVDVELLNDIYKSDSLLFISSNILYQDQIPSELKQVTKLSNKSKTFNSHRWTISGLSCFIIRNSSKNIEMAKKIWSTFRYVEVSRSLYDYYRPSYTELLNVEETACPSV